MREIIFRGKRADNGKWVYGSLLIDPDLEYYNIIGFNYYNSEDGLEREEFTEEVIPETVGQYTGLKDKNGTKIFEGDIVEGLDYTQEDEGCGIVGFNDGAFEVSGNNCVGTFHENYWGTDFEVIGNIYDNIELLEVAE